jgi:hypothetical protein
VNERLFVCGLMDDWDAATTKRDLAAMIVLLERIEVSDPEWAARSALANSAANGA